MPIATICSGCKTQYKVNDSLAGKKAKCTKCGAVMVIPFAAVPAEPVLDPLSPVPAADPLGGNWSSGGPLGGFDANVFPAEVATPAAWPAHPAGPAMMRPSAPPKDAGLNKLVWITVGVGGAICLLLVSFVVFQLLFGGDSSSEVAQSNVPAGGSSAAPAAKDPNTASVKPSVEAAVPGTAAVSAAPVNDSAPWRWQAETLPSISADVLATPVRIIDRPGSAHFTRPDVAQAILTVNRYGAQRDVLVRKVDLKTGHPLGEHSLAANSKVFDVSRDGSAVLVLPGEKFAQQEDLQVWRWNSSGLEKVADWMPYASRPSKRYAWCLMLDANRVLTFHSQDDAAVAWDASRGKELFRIPGKLNHPPVLTAGGTALIVHSGLWLQFFQADSGRHIASLGPLPNNIVSLSAAAVSHDGKRLAALFLASGSNSQSLTIFDTTQGKLLDTIEAPWTASSLQWVSPEYLLAGSHLVSLQHQMPVWEYTGWQAFSQPFDSRAWFVSAIGGEHYLSAAVIPSPAVASKIASFAAANTPILKAGDSVGLQVAASGPSVPAGLHDKLKTSFREKLSAAGYTVADGQRPFRLQVTITEQDSGKPLEYRMFGGPGASGSTVQVPNRRIECNVAFVDSRGSEVWKHGNTFGPAMMSFNRGGGDFAQEVLNARWKTFDSFVQFLRIPPEVRRFSSSGKFGMSSLTASGEQILSVPTP